jgi:hypothetical protein
MPGNVIADVAYMHVWSVARYTTAQIIFRVRQNTSIYNHGQISFVRFLTTVSTSGKARLN